MLLESRQIGGYFCQGARCVISWSIYGLKQGIPWKFFSSSVFLLILCVPNVTKYSYHDTG